MCTATEHVRPPLDFTWLVNDTDLEEAITRLHIRGSVKLENSFGEKSSTSELTVVFAKESDSGLYKLVLKTIYEKLRMVFTESLFKVSTGRPDR